LASCDSDRDDDPREVVGFLRNVELRAIGVEEG
jgi:hypothetical protein